MTDYEVASSNREIAYAIKDLARAVTTASYKRTDPIFVFVPSDMTPEKARALGEELSRAFRRV